MEKTQVDDFVGANNNNNNKSQQVQQTALEKFNARLAKTNQIQNKMKEEKKMKNLLKTEKVTIAIEKVVPKKDGGFYVPRLETVNDVLYSVDINGNLHQIDVNTLVEKPVYRSVNSKTNKPIVFVLDVNMNQSNNKIMIDTLKLLGYISVEVKDAYRDPKGYYHILNVTEYNGKKYVTCGTSLILLKNIKTEKKIVLTREKDGKYIHSFLDVDISYFNSNEEKNINAVFNAAFAYLNK